MAKNSKNAIILAAGIASGLIAGANAYAQNFKVPKYNPAYWTADGVLVTPSIVTLSRDKDIDVDSDLISGRNITSLTSPDPINVVKDKIYFLENSKRAKQYYTEEARQRQIGIYEGLLQQISSEKRTPEYYRSVKNLREALKNDHVLTRKELEGIVGGFTYALDKKGKDPVVGNYDAPMLVTFPVVQKTPEIQSLQPAPVPKDNNYPLPTPKVQEKSSLPLCFIGGLNYSSHVNSIGIDAGIRYGNNEDLVNLALLLSYQKGLSNESLVSTNPVSPAGIYGVNTTDMTNFQSFGFDTSLYLGSEKIKGIIGAGYHLESKMESQTAENYRGSQLLNSNTSKPETRLDSRLRAYIGLDVKAGDSRLEFDAGIENDLSFKKIDAFFGSRISIAPPSKYKGR